MRTVSTTIANPQGGAREGLRVDFHAADPAQSTFATTDAGGVFVATLESGVTYHVPTSNPFTVAGVPFPAGAMFVVQVPEGDGAATLAESLVGVLDMSLPAIHARLAAIEAALQLPTPEPTVIPVPEGEGS